MPEGHKTHFLARQHDQSFAGEVLKISSPQGRFRGDARRISGSVLDSVEATGKHLFYHFDGGRILHIHLGRYGQIISVTAAEVGRPLATVEGRDRFRVYGKEECPRCLGPIGTIDLASRKLYLCEHCQCG